MDNITHHKIVVRDIMNGKMVSFMLVSSKKVRCKVMESYTYQMVEWYRVNGRMVEIGVWQKFITLLKNSY